MCIFHSPFFSCGLFPGGGGHGNEETRGGDHNNTKTQSCTPLYCSFKEKNSKMHLDRTSRFLTSGKRIHKSVGIMGIQSPGHGRFCSAMVDSHTAYKKHLFPGEARRNNSCLLSLQRRVRGKTKSLPRLVLRSPPEERDWKTLLTPHPILPLPPFIHTWTELRRLFATCSPFYFSSLIRQKCGSGGLTSFCQINDLRPPFSHTFSIVLQTQRTHKRGKILTSDSASAKKSTNKKSTLPPTNGAFISPVTFFALSPQ